MSGGPKSSLARQRLATAEHTAHARLRFALASPVGSRPDRLHSRARRVYLFHLCSLTTFLVIVRVCRPGDVAARRRRSGRSRGRSALPCDPRTSPGRTSTAAASSRSSECPPSVRMDATASAFISTPALPRPDPEDSDFEPEPREGPRPDPDPDPGPGPVLVPLSSLRHLQQPRGVLLSVPSSSPSVPPHHPPAPSVRVFSSPTWLPSPGTPLAPSVPRAISRDALR